MGRPPFRVAAPVDGLWRVNRVGSELLSRDYGALPPGDTTAGNRYDSISGSFRISYLGTTLEACFGEVLAPLRPDPVLVKLVVDDWHYLNFMEIGTIASDWRIRREAVRLVPSRKRRFFDVESVEALQILRTEIGAEAKRLGHADIDVATVRGPDRRVTRLISEWVHAQTTPGGNPAFPASATGLGSTPTGSVGPCLIAFTYELSRQEQSWRPCKN